MRKLPTLLGALLLAVAVQAQDFTQNLTAEQRAAAGLDKLNAAELARLKEIVERYKAGEVAVVRQVAEQKVAAAEAKAQEAESRATAATTERKSGPGWLGALITINRAEKNLEAVDVLTSRLEGTLKTFNGRRSFTLKNGQVWTMLENGSYAGPTYTDPEVEIRPGAMGAFWLRIPEAALRVKVKPIKLE